MATRRIFPRVRNSCGGCILSLPIEKVKSERIILFGSVVVLTVYAWKVTSDKKWDASSKISCTYSSNSPTTK